MLLIFSSLMLPSLVVALLPNSVEKAVFSSIANAQESPPATNIKKKVLKVGVLAIRGKEKAIPQWQPHVEYLSDNIPEYAFELIPLTIDEFYEAAEKNELDFVITNPGMYVNLEAMYGVNRLVSLKNLRLGNSYTVFGAVIFTRADRNDINELEDFKGKTFMGVKEIAFGGWQMAWRIFKDRGIKPKHYFKDLRFGGTHDKVVMAVLNGEVDGGTVRTDSLERMAAEGKIKLEDFKILNQQKDPSGQFPFVHSTALYPEWPFAASKRVPLEISEQVAKALLNNAEG